MSEIQALMSFIWLIFFAWLLLQGKEKYTFPNPNPFVEDDMDKNEVASVAYRYVVVSSLQRDGGLGHIAWMGNFQTCWRLHAYSLLLPAYLVMMIEIELCLNYPLMAMSLTSILGCRYRRWKLGDDIDLIVRCEHDGVMTGANGEVSFINIKTLNEWDSRVRKIPEF